MDEKRHSDENKRRRTPKRHPLNGRHLLTLGAVSLLGVSGYELWIRLEDFWAWTSGVRHLSSVRGTPFLEDLGIIFETPEMRQLGFKLLFLLAAVIFGIVCVCRRNRATGAWLLMLLAAALAGGGAILGLYSFNLSDWAQTLKLVPLALIIIGCGINIGHRSVLRRRHHHHHHHSHESERS